MTMTLKQLATFYDLKQHGIGRLGMELLINVDAKSDELAEIVRLEFGEKSRRKKYGVSINDADLDNFLIRMKTHRRKVAEQGLELLTRLKPDKKVRNQFLHNLITHDADKYSIINANAYADLYAGRKTRDPAKFSSAVSAHHALNPHHWDHWVDDTKDGKVARAAIPEHNLLEMLADWAATASENNDKPDFFYRKFGHGMTLHPQTRMKLDLHFGIKRDSNGRIRK